MQCSNCGTQNPEGASFCRQCGNPLAEAQPPTQAPAAVATVRVPTHADLASLWARFGSSLLDGFLGAIPYVGFIPWIISLVMYRRGQTIGLKAVGARIVRGNGDLSGFFHTYVRNAAGILSAIPLGLGYWWALWDADKQTWHDKLLDTYVVRDTAELAARRGTSSRAAVVWFWAIIALVIVFIALLVVLVIFLLVFFASLFTQA